MIIFREPRQNISETPDETLLESRLSTMYNVVTGKQ